MCTGQCHWRAWSIFLIRLFVTAHHFHSHRCHDPSLLQSRVYRGNWWYAFGFARDVGYCQMDGVRFYDAGIIIDFNMPFVEFWCILATNIKTLIHQLNQLELKWRSWFTLWTLNLGLIFHSRLKTYFGFGFVGPSRA